MSARVSKTKRKTASKAKTRTRVTTRAGILDLENGLGRMMSANAIARTLKQAADASENLTAAPFHAAMAALNHLIDFLDRQRVRLEAAKRELRRLYGEELDDETGRPLRRTSEARRTTTVRSPRKRPRKRGHLDTAAAIS